MLSTSLFLGLALFLLVGQVLLAAWLLRIGVRWAKAGTITFKRAVGTTLIIKASLVVMGIAFYWGNDLLLLENLLQARAILAAEILAMLVVSWLIVERMLRTTFRKGIFAWLPTLLETTATLFFLYAVFVPFLFEFFYIPTNNMAPTLVGRHYQDACPSCRSTLYVSPISNYSPYRRDEACQYTGICGSCLQASEVSNLDKTVFRGDRIIASKFLRPKRWDVIVFRFPYVPYPFVPDPESPQKTTAIYAKRLVGLPGERIAIKDGHVWINGKKAKKPEALSGLVYTTGFDPDSEKREWGPVTLGDGEYFVLGDFSKKSSDSRAWTTSFGDHAPYAVPESNILGVVTHIYWPPSRWRILR